MKDISNNKITLKENEIPVKIIQKNDHLNDYIKELHEDVRLTNSNLKEKSLMVSGIRAKWLNYYFMELETQKLIKKNKDRIVKEASKLKNFSESILSIKNVDKFSENSQELKELDKKSDVIKTSIDFIERAMNILNDFGFQIKNSIEITKLERM